MKKLLFVIALGAFAACGNGNSSETTDSTTSVTTGSSSMSTDSTGAGAMTTDTTSMSTPH